MIADIYDSNDFCIETNISGSSDSIYITTTTHSSIQTNVVVSSEHTLKFWGQILASNGLPLYKVPIELIEIHYITPHYHFNKLAETTTDESGFYYFNYTTSMIYCYYLHVVSSNTLNDNILFPNLNRCSRSSHNYCICYDILKKEVPYDIIINH